MEELEEHIKNYRSKFEELRGRVDRIDFPDSISRNHIEEKFDVSFRGKNFNVVIANLPKKRSSVEKENIYVHYRLGTKSKRARVLYELIMADLHGKEISEINAKGVALKYHRTYLES